MPITTKNLLLKKTKFHSLTGNTQKTTPGNRLSPPINYCACADCREGEPLLLPCTVAV